MISRRDWWLGVLLIVFALLLHALLPRYTVSMDERGLAQRHDRWTGRIEVGAIAVVPWAAIYRPPLPAPAIGATIEALPPKSSFAEDLETVRRAEADKLLKEPRP